MARPVLNRSAAALVTGLLALAGHAHAQCNLPKWVRLTPQNAPPARYAPAFAFDHNAGVAVLYGGVGANGRLADTWTWDGSNWTRKSPFLPQGLGPQSNSAAAFSTFYNRVVMHGGLTVEQTALATGASERTVKRDWAFARAWPADALALFKESAALRHRHNHPEPDAQWASALADIAAAALTRAEHPPGPQWDDAAQRLERAHAKLTNAAASQPATSTPAARARRLATALADLYDARHRAEPGVGHDQTAARWREQAR